MMSLNVCNSCNIDWINVSLLFRSWLYSMYMSHYFAQESQGNSESVIFLHSHIIDSPFCRRAVKFFCSEWSRNSVCTLLTPRLLKFQGVANALGSWCITHLIKKCGAHIFILWTKNFSWILWVSVKCHSMYLSELPAYNPVAPFVLSLACLKIFTFEVFHQVLFNGCH